MYIKTIKLRFYFCHSFSANPNGNTDVIKVNERAGKSRFISNKMYVSCYSLMLYSKLSTWLGLTLPFEKQIYYMRKIQHIHCRSRFVCKTKGRCNQWYTYMYLLYAAFLLTLVAWVNIMSLFCYCCCSYFHFHSPAQKMYTLPGRQFCCICVLLQCQYYIGAGANAEDLSYTVFFANSWKVFFLFCVVVDIIVANGDEGGWQYIEEYGITRKSNNLHRILFFPHCSNKSER